MFLWFSRLSKFYICVLRGIFFFLLQFLTTMRIIVQLQFLLASRTFLYNQKLGIVGANCLLTHPISPVTLKKHRPFVAGKFPTIGRGRGINSQKKTHGTFGRKIIWVLHIHWTAGQRRILSRWCPPSYKLVYNPNNYNYRYNPHNPSELVLINQLS